MKASATVIQRLRKEKGLTLEELGAAVGLSKRQVWSREWGEYSLKPSEHAKFAAAFGLTTQQFRELIGDEFTIGGPKPLVSRIPVVNSVKAGVTYDLSGSQLEGEELAKYVDMIDRGDIQDPSAFAVRVDGDSMEPTICDGATVVCEPLRKGADQSRLQDGKIVVVTIENARGRSYQIGRFAWDGTKKFQLLKDNARYPVQSFGFTNEAVQRIGIVVEVRFKP